MKHIVTAKAPVNIALIKYWGKEDEAKVIPYTGSLSLSVSELYTVTTIKHSSHGFSFTLNGKKASKADALKIKKFLSHFAQEHELEDISVISENTGPTASGAASSASGFAALAKAANTFFETNFENEILASITRLGSGSACRSLFGGLVVWEKTGEVYTIREDGFDFIMVFALLTHQRKSISSKQAMKNTVSTSPYYEAWVSKTTQDLIAMKHAIHVEDLRTIGELTQSSALAMHASMLSATPPTLFLTHHSLEIIHGIMDLQRHGEFAYPTMDAGMHVKILTNAQSLPKVLETLDAFKVKDIIVTHPEKGAHILYEE
ncbi:MAG: diphosphomevalonate decarboxylase [Erysipelothrix sp.]|jgi:diphosphomevalonate decarboxylase|nr:diphosphomevalonate decarboxylase [Erysipelothrix sp.]